MVKDILWDATDVRLGSVPAIRCWFEGAIVWEREQPYLVVTPTEVSLPSEGGVKQLSVQSNMSWAIK